MSRTIRWGIIGVGDVTEVKSGPGFQKANNSSLVAVMRRNGDLAKDYAERHGVPRWYDDADALIHDDEVDAVYIATPPSSHKELTLKVAAAKKPVFVEKPMALTFEECEAMIAACESADVPLWVAFYRRTMPRFAKIKAILDAGTIGAVRTVTIRHYHPSNANELDSGNLPWRVRPEISGGGIFVDMGAHMLDFLDYVVSPIKTAQGSATNQNGDYTAEDTVAGTFEFESGAIGTGIWCYSGFDDLDETIITGTQGSIAFSAFDEAPVKLTTRAGVETFSIANPEHVHQPLIQTIVDELNGVGTSPSTGVSGARATRVIDQLLQDYRARMVTA
jgi:predicted dehydrogenase